MYLNGKTITWVLDINELAFELFDREVITSTRKVWYKLFLISGAACDNFMGYCDVFQKCRGVDADGPLARLKNLLFNEETFKNIKDWIIVSYI